MPRNWLRLDVHSAGLLGLCALWAGALAQPCLATSAHAISPLSHSPVTALKADSLVCPEGTVTGAEQSLHVVVTEGDGYEACRLDPTNSRHAIVALAYPSPNSGTKQDQSQLVEDNDFDFLVDIVIVDIASGNVLLHSRKTDDFYWTGGFVGLWIDTARYDLAPGLRAFGVRIQQHENCGNDCEITNTQLALYVQRGMKLQTLLATKVGEHQDGAGPDGEGYAAHRSVTVLCMGRKRSHGLANIWGAERRLDSVESDEEVEIDAGRVPCGPGAPNRMLWRYNGKQYVP